MSQELNTPQEQLNELFGSYKAEWLREQIFDLYTEPTYFPELTTARPCLLVGGRGTGKTSVLRSMSYEGQHALSAKNVQHLQELPFIGLYYRVDTNRVTALKGPELTERQWVKTFGHYFNLILCDLILRAVEWYQLHGYPNVQIGESGCDDIAISLNLPTSTSVQGLRQRISKALIEFEAHINNIADGSGIALSLQGAPVEVLAKEVLKLEPFKGKLFFFLIDEYENFEDYQQQVMNTLIKHSGTLYSFKVGVKELGWRVRTTLNTNEQLISPADYVRINIAEKLEGDIFKAFALTVCEKRIEKLQLGGMKLPPISNLLVEISDEEEAVLLDEGSGIITKAVSQLKNAIPIADLSRFDNMATLEQYFLVFWSENQRTSLELIWKDYVANNQQWKIRYGNYKHALLFAIRKGKRGIQKYYAGWSVFTHLAATNIRYLLELVDQALLLHIQKGKSLDTVVDPETQTVAAQRVGKKNLAELEGLSVHGAHLTKLLLALGRIFQVMAANPAGHAPEIDQFRIIDKFDDLGDQSYSLEMEQLVRSAIMHLALLRSPGTKAAAETDTKEYDYMIHPIFSAYFVFSYRRKRKISLSARQLYDLIKNPAKAISEILSIQGRSDDESFPEQMRLFESYYASATR